MEASYVRSYLDIRVRDYLRGDTHTHTPGNGKTHTTCDCIQQPFQSVKSSLDTPSLCLFCFFDTVDGKWDNIRSTNRKIPLALFVTLTLNWDWIPFQSSCRDLAASFGDTQMIRGIRSDIWSNRRVRTRDTPPYLVWLNFKVISDEIITFGSICISIGSHTIATEHSFWCE